MELFAGYGFAKSHSTAYAFLAYQTAYLKANYPWHFAAALLTIEAQNTDKLAVYLAESRERAIPILPPDINASQLNFSVEPGEGVRFGLTAIKGLGEGAVNSVLAVRSQLGGQVKTLHQLCELIDLRLVNKRVFEALVKSGACDGLGGFPADTLRREVRARLFASIDSAFEHGSRTQRDRDLGQADLFNTGEGGVAAAPSAALPVVPAWSEVDQLNFEKESLGLYWSGHPVDRYAGDLVIYGAKTTVELAPRKDVEPGVEAEGGGPPAERSRGEKAEDVSVGGIVGAVRALKTRKGDRMCVFMLDDAHGSVEVVVFPETFKQWGHLAESGQMVVVTGKLERDDETARILASEVASIDVLSERLSTSVAITVTTPPHDRATVERLWDVLAHHKGDRSVALTVELRPPLRPLRVRMDVHSQIRVRPSDRLVADIERVCGQGSVTLGKATPTRAPITTPPMTRGPRVRA